MRNSLFKFICGFALVFFFVSAKANQIKCSDILADEVGHTSYSLSQFDQVFKKVSDVQLHYGMLKEFAESGMKSSEQGKALFLKIYETYQSEAYKEKYFAALDKDIEAYVNSSGREEDIALFQQGLVSRKIILGVLMKRARDRGEKVQILKDELINDLHRFYGFIKGGPFLDYAFVGNNTGHGTEAHLFQYDFLYPVLNEFSGGKIKELLNLVGQDSGFWIWRILFDAYGTEDFSDPVVVNQYLNERYQLSKYYYTTETQMTVGLSKRLDIAKKMRSRSKITLDSDIEVDGKLMSYAVDSNNLLAYLSFKGATRLSEVLPGVLKHPDQPEVLYQAKQIQGQADDHHVSGFGTAIGKFAMKSSLHSMKSDQSSFQGSVEGFVGEDVALEFNSGVRVMGQLKAVTKNSKGVVVIMTFKNCTVTYKDKTLFAPSWGPYDMVLGNSISTVGL
jgi:hypothetical protein